MMLAAFPPWPGVKGAFSLRRTRGPFPFLPVVKYFLFLSVLLKYVAKV